MDVQDRLGDKLAHSHQGSKEHDGGPRGQKLPAAASKIAPSPQELLIRLPEIKAFVYLMKSRSIPGKAISVKHLLQRDAIEYLAIPAVGGGVPEHPLDLMHLGFVVTAAPSQKGAANIAVQVKRFVLAGCFRNPEN